MPDVVYNRGKALIASQDFDAATLRMLLLGGGSAPSGHGAAGPDLDFVSDLLALGSVAELTATNYARQTLTTVAVTIDDPNDRAVVTCDSIVFADLGVPAGSEGPARAAVIYLDGVNDAARALIAFYDTGFPKALNGEDLTISDPLGILRLT